MTTRRRRRPIVVILIALVVALLLLEAAVVVAVFTFPSSGDSLRRVAANVEEAWNGTANEPGFRTRAAERIHRGYLEWVVPLWSGEEAPAGTPAFSECVECHSDYAKTRRFSSVYMNHPQHAELGVPCATCHPQNIHPNPPRPEEQVCADCHTEVEEKGKCSTCHPPGSLPHFYLLGAPRKAVTDCNVCHPTENFGTTASEPLVEGTFTGEDPNTCRGCHEQFTCTTCHEPGHPSGWITAHGPTAADVGPIQCYQCHTGLWCGSRCHAVTSTNPTNRQPLPDAGVRPS